jgi:endonuclease YncB( thermonuclease family)
MLKSAALILTFCALATAAESFKGEVMAITDGDTIRVMREGRAVPVRLDGIDAPERKQPFGTRAKEFTGALAFGNTATVEIIGTDRYRRIIGRVVLEDGRVLNEELLKAGLAWVFVKYCKEERYYAFEADARKRNVGLWRDADAVAPWEFRKQRVAERVR